jgi:biotin-dependent carboxylase-like uncharacterized protein
MIEIIEPGLATTVQDAGRQGYYHLGMPPSGAMDKFAHEVANALVGNDPSAAALEMTYLGPELKFHEDVTIAVAGAEIGPTLDGESIEMNRSYEVESGQTLSLDATTDGVRSYLAVSGGVDVPLFMGSRSTYTLIGIGGFEGRTLEAGDELPIGEAPNPISDRSVDESLLPEYGNEGPIRVVMGLCDYRLADEGKAEFLGTTWTVSDEADRIGYRLEGPDDFDLRPLFVEREQPFGAGTDITNVVDVGYPVGSIQMAGQPIVLMRDAVTGGGYATVGTVISVDRNRLAQRRTHRSVEFESVGVDAAIDARVEQEETISRIREQF